LELQRLMFHHNNALTSSHPYASFPLQWPFLLRGVSFWTNEESRQQIYFLGNPIGWWFASSILAVFAGIIFADQLSVRRGIDALDRREYKLNTLRVCFITNPIQQALAVVFTTALVSSFYCGLHITPHSSSWAVSSSSTIIYRLILRAVW
jgi:hypothetical protein